MAIQVTTGTGTVQIDGGGVLTLLSGALPDAVGSALVFKPPKNPDQGPELPTKANIFAASFGDAYTQVGKRGLNHITTGLALSWSLLTVSQKEALDAFFRERGGYQPFFYGLPGDVIRQWRCEEWAPRGRGHIYWGFSASFISDFNPVV